MTVSTRKICIIGDFGVGKTSTVARYVHNVFSEKYLTTVGVKIDTSEIELDDGRALKLVIWDIAGADRFSAVEFSYLRGAAGYLIVADGTRLHTVDTAERLRNEAFQRYGEIPYVLLLNKSDLDELWEVPERRMQALRSDDVPVFMTSAKSGTNVVDAIRELAIRVAAQPGDAGDQGR